MSEWTSWESVKVGDLEEPRIIYEKRYHTSLKGGVARVLINAPERFNAFDDRMAQRMYECFYDASTDKAVGVVVLGGTGGHFSSGGDINWEKAGGARQAFYWEYAPNRMIRICRKPVIARVQGYCIGGGHHLAYCCDFTIADETAIFGQNGPKIGSPADGYIVSYLVRVVGAKKAREIWMLCRRYSASEALRMGLINAVVPSDRLDEEIDRWCEEILSKSPSCIQILKASFDWELDAMPQMGLIMNWLRPGYFESPEVKEGGDAFFQRRQPNFWTTQEQS